MATCLAALLLLASPWAVSWRAASSPWPDELLRAAVLRGDTRAMERAVDMGARVDGRNAVGMSPLAEAALEGRVPSVRWLIARGADVDGPLCMGVTPLFTALWRPDAVAALAEAGADVNARLPESGRTPLLAACNMGDEDVALGAVEALLAAGADVNAPCARGSRPLAEAAGAGHARVVRRLLEAGADVNAADAAGTTAVMAAATEGHTGVVAILRRAGAVQ